MAALNLLFMCVAIYMIGKVTHDLLYALCTRLLNYFLSRFGSPK